MPGAAFTAAVDVLFADDQLATDGTFTAPPNPGIPVRVIVERHDPVLGPEPGVRSPGCLLHLARAQVAAKPREGDTLTIAGTTYTVRAVAEDIEQTTWTLDVDEV